MNISAWAIKRPIPIIVLFMVLTLLGLMAYRGLGVNEWPDVDFPTVIVQIAQPGASPDELETEVTRKVEDALVGIAHLEHVRSTVSEGLSATVVEFEIGSPSETALNDVRDAVSRIRQNLPADITEPSIIHPNGSGEPFITYTVGSSKRSVAELSRLVDEDITRALLTVSGVATVDRAGGLKREVGIKLSPSRLSAMGTSVEAVNAQLRALNLNLPGGRADIGGQEQGVRTLGSARSIEDLRALRISLGSGPTAQSVRLDTLGTVTDGYAEVRQKAFLNGQPVVSFSVQRALGAALVQTEEGVQKQVKELQKTLPPDVEIKLIRTMADFTRAAFHASLDALLIGGGLAVLVILVFLRNWQATFISALAIPLSIISTFALMKYLGYSLNGMTMIGLTLVVGILVDDAIVDLENIHRHMAMGKSAMKAALEATDEIGLAVIATTLTIVAVFVPVSFMGGIPGMFFRSFGLTVAVSVLFSLLVARTLTPMMAAYMLPNDHKEPEHSPFYQTFYLRVLNWALDHRGATLVMAFAIFLGSLTLAPMIPKGLFSNGDTAEAVVTVALPAGSAIADTEMVVAKVEEILKARPEVRGLFTTVGSAGGTNWQSSSGASVATANISVMLVPKHDRKTTPEGFARELAPLLTAVPGARISIRGSGGVGGGKPINIILRGTDAAALELVSEKLLAEMRGVPGLRDVTSSAAELRPELLIKPNFAQAAEQGVSVQAIGRIARLATQGDVDFNLPKYNAGDQQLNIRVQLTDEAKADLATIGDLRVPGRNGLVPLRTVADVELGTGPVQLSRYDRARQVSFSANLGDATLGDAVAKIQALPTLKNLPQGVTQDTLGQSKIMADIFGGFMFAFATGTLFIYAVLVLLFGSFLQPITIMAALPLSIGGALAGLLFSGKELGMMGLIGILMLMGLVTKNSILLVEYAIMERRKGMGRREALLHSGRDRLRPILMTTIAMIAGMLPIALEFGEGTERLSPMAAAVIGGLITSTLLTLVVVPATYTFVDDFQNWLRRTFGKKTPETPESVEEEHARESVVPVHPHG